MTANITAVLALSCVTIAAISHDRSITSSLVSLAWACVGLALAVEYVHQVSAVAP